MTLQLNFEKGKMKFLLSQIKWLQEIGLITSFKIEKEDSEEEDFEISDEEADEILEALEDIEAGNFLTHEEVLKDLKNG